MRYTQLTDEHVKEMLGALNDRRPVGFLGDMDDALHQHQASTVGIAFTCG
jgi:hypothetical protein